MQLFELVYLHNIAKNLTSAKNFPLASLVTYINQKCFFVRMCINKMQWYQAQGQCWLYIITRMVCTALCNCYLPKLVQWLCLCCLIRLFLIYLSSRGWSSLKISVASHHAASSSPVWHGGWKYIGPASINGRKMLNEELYLFIINCIIFFDENKDIISLREKVLNLKNIGKH